MNTMSTAVPYSYDPVDQLTEVIQKTSSGNYRISFAYDLRGLQIENTSPETGSIQLNYDAQGNLIKKTDPLLRKSGTMIRHEYDGLGRLSRTDYPDMEDVTYRYGNPESHKSINAAGRLLSSSDESGIINYEYGRMDEVTLEKRTLKSQRHGKTLSAKTGFQSD